MIKNNFAGNLLVFLLLTILVLVGCTLRPKLTGPDVAMRLTAQLPVLQDDLPIEDLVGGIQQNIDRLNAKTDLEFLTFGPRRISRTDYVLALHFLVEVLTKNEKPVALQMVSENFDFYEIYGDRKWGEVFMTSYYDPVIKGSIKKTETFSQALYAVPKDLVTIQFGEFLQTFPRLQLEVSPPHEQKSKGEALRGRLVVEGVQTPQIVPYYSRKQIDVEGALEGKGLELAWVDPIKAFTLQIQGSGVIEFEDGKRVRLGYAGQNGHGYVSIGKFLTDVIPLEKMSMHAIETHLATLPQDKMQEILNLNPSYVFFQSLDSKSMTFFGTEVVAGRTIATDYRYFPKGAVGFLEFEQPVFAGEEMTPSVWLPTARFILDQDTGG